MNDPYTDTTECVARLLTEWHRHKKLILAVDFDDTVYDFHRIGHTYERALRLIRTAGQLGFYVLLFTGTAPAEWPRQCAFLERHGVKVDAVNANPIPLPFGNHGKPYYNILLDDRAGLGQALDTLEELITQLIEEVEEGATTKS